VADATRGADTKAAQTVFPSGIPLVVVPLDATADLKLSAADLKRIFSPASALTLQVQALYQMSDEQSPGLADALTVALSFRDEFCKLEEMHLAVDDKGFTRRQDGKPNCRVATAM